MPGLISPKIRRTAGARLAVVAATAVLPFTLASCTDNASANTAGASDGPIQVTSTDAECKVSATEAPSGNLTFAVKNDGTEVTEFYVLAVDGLPLVAEVDDLGPGISRDLVLTAPAGEYITACKPGMKGDGIRGDFTVKDSGSQSTADASHQKLVDTGVAQYTAYVKDQTEQLVAGTKKFATAYAAGDTAKAKSLYAATRM